MIYKRKGDLKMKEVKALLEGQIATPHVLEINEYKWDGFYLNDPIYANALNHIVVRDDMVLRVYEEHRSQLELDLCGEA